MEEDYLLFGTSKYFVLEKKLQSYSKSKIKQGYVPVCSGSEDVIKDYIKKHNISDTAIKTLTR